MKDSISKISKKITVGLLLLILAAFTIFCSNVGVLEASAAEETTITERDDYVSVKYSDVSDYIKNSGHVAPTYGKNGAYVFAGWYKDSACEEVYSDIKTDTTNVYAKFVATQILSVKAQLQKDTTSKSSKTNLRLVSSVDSLNYHSVGFEVYYNGSKEPIVVKSSTVYKRIVASESSGVDYNYNPKVVDTASEYFVTTTLLNINSNNFDKSFFIKPYWKTLDGTTVYGEGKFITVNNGIDENSINVTVKTSNTLNSSLKVTVAGVEYDATVAYQDDNYAYLNIDLKKNKSTLDSLSVISVDEASTTYRNLLKKYTGTADTTWYTATPTGTNDFVVVTSADLYGLANLVNTNKELFNQKTVYMGADITINNGTATVQQGFVLQNKSDTLYDWLPIGGGTTSMDYKPFSGTFDGQGHTISGLYFKSSGQYLGLFGVTPDDGSATIKNLKVTNSYFESTKTSEHTGQIDGIGGIIGRGAGTLDTIYCDAIIVSKTQSVGGMVGVHRFGPLDMTNCWFAGKATGRRIIGGMVGFGHGNVTHTNMTDCLVTAELTSIMTSGDAFIGGLAGYMTNGKIDSCIIQGTFTGPAAVRGFFGGFGSNESQTIELSKLYHAANATSWYAGGKGTTKTAELKNISEDDLKGTKGYTNTLLSFYDKNINPMDISSG